MNELRPCPFCGGEACCKSDDAGWDYRGDNVFVATVGCPNCGASFELEHHGDDLLRDDDIEGETCHALEEQAAALWNARAIDRDELLKVADECESADVDGVSDLAARIRNAAGTAKLLRNEVRNDTEA